MAERCVESGSLDVRLSETETQEIKHERRVEMATREDLITTALLEVSSDTAVKITEGEQTKMAGGSRLSREDDVDSDHHQLPVDARLMSNPVAEEETPAVKPAADVLQNDSLFSFGASPPACQTTDGRDHALMDDLGTTTSLDENNMEFLPLNTQKGDDMQSGESVEAQQLMLLPPNDQTDTEKQDRCDVITSRQTPTTAESKEENRLYHSVLHQMQQQQKHKPGRKFKKKTLMKMAKLFVIAKGWDAEMMETSEGKYSNGPSTTHEPLELKQKEDAFTSVSLVTAQREEINTNSPKDGKNDCDKETVLSTVSTDTFSDQTAAPATLKKRKTTSTCNKRVKEESELSGAAETDCSTSTNLLHKSDVTQEPLLYSRPVTASEKKLTPKEDTEITCDNSELSVNVPAEISSVDAPKKQRKKRKGSKVGVKKSTKQKALAQTLTEYNDVMTQDVSEGFLVPRNEPLLAYSSSIQDTIFKEMDLNAAKEEHEETSELIPDITSSFQDEISPVESVSSAVPARKTTRKRQRRNKTEQPDGKNDCDKETVLSTVSTDTFSDQTAAPVTLKNRKTTSTCNKRVKEESELSGAAETDCSTSTNLLHKSDEAQEPLLYSRPVTASEKKLTPKEDTEITCDNSELSVNVPAEISSVDAPKKQRKKRKGSKVGVKKSTKQKALAQTLTEYNDVMTQDVSEGFLVPRNEPLLAYSSSIQDTIFKEMDLNAAKQEHEETSELTTEVTASFQDEISPVESVSSAVPARKTTRKRQRRNKTEQPDGKNDCDKETVLSTVSTDTFSDQTAAPVTLKRRKTTSTCNKQVKEESELSGTAETDCSTSAYNSLIQDTIFKEMDLNAPKQEHDKSEISEITSEVTSSFPVEISPVASVSSAVPARKTTSKRQRRNKTGWTDGKNDCDKETVLSTVSTDTFSDQTAAPVTLKNRKTTSTCKKQVKEESELSGAAETDCSTSTNLLHKSDEAQEPLLYSSPVTASEKKLTPKEDTEITCDNSELSVNVPAEISSVDAPKKQRKKRKGSKVGVKKSTKQKALAQTLTEYNDVMTQDVSEGFLVPRNEPLLAYSSSIQDTIFKEMDLNAAKQEHDEEQTSELIPDITASFQDEISPVASVSSAVPARKTARKRQRRNKTEQPDGKNDIGKETVLSTVSTDTFSDQTAAPVTLKNRKTTSTCKKQVKEESELSGAAETDCSTSTNLLHKSDVTQESLLYSRPVTASEKKLTPKEDTEITCDNSELSVNVPAEISSVDAPKKQRKKRKGSKVGVKKSTKQKALAQTLTEYNDVMTQDVSEGFLVPRNEPLLAYSSSIQDTIFKEMDLNAAKEEHEESSELTTEVTSSFQDEISPVESVPSAVPARKTTRKRQRRNKTEQPDGKNDCDKETVLSTVSTDTFSDQTAAPVTLKRRKTTSTCNKQVKEESELSGAAETDCSTSTNLLHKSDEAQESLLYSRPVTASEKKLTPKEDTEITCDNSELSVNVPAEISSVDAPKKQRKKRKGSKVGVKKSTKQKALAQTLTEYHDVMTQDVSDGFLVPRNEPLLAYSSSIQDTIFKEMDLNAAKQEHDEEEMSALIPDITASFLDEISPVESVSSAVPARKTARKRQRRNKTEQPDGKNDIGKETVLSTVSTDTFSDQTTAPVTLKKRKTTSTCNKQVKEESELSGTAETDCSTSAYNSSIQDTIVHGMDLNAPKQEHDKSETSELTTEVTSSFPVEISPAESVSSAVPARKTTSKRQRRNKTGWTDGKNDCDKETVLSTVSTDTFSDQTAAPVTLKKRKTTSTCNKQVKEESELSGTAETDCSTSAYNSSIQDTIVHGMDLNAPKQEHDKSETSELTTEVTSSFPVEISPAESVSSAVPARKTTSKRQRRNKTGWTDGKNDCDKETVLSTVSTDTFSDQTAAPVILKRRKTTSTRKQQVKEESELSGAAETDCSTSTNLLHKSDEAQESLLYSSPVTASEKKLTPKEDTEITCDNSELSVNVPAEISSVDAPKKQRKKRKGSKVGVKKSTKQKALAQTLTEYHDVMTQDVSEGFLVPRNEPLLAYSSSTQDTIFKEMDLNAAKQEHEETSELTTEVTSSFQDEISPVESVPSAVPTRKTTRKRQRRNKTGWTDGKNDCDKETVLSTVSTDTFSDQTAAPVTLKRRKTTSTCKQQVKEESDLSGAAETDCNMSAYSSSIQDTIFDGMDLNAAKQQHDNSEMSELISVATSSFPNEISLVESVSSAVNARKTKGKRRRRNKTGWVARKKLKQTLISAHCNKPANMDMSAFSFNSSPFNSISGDEMIDLKLKDENDVKEINTEQTQTAKTKVKHPLKLKNFHPRRHKLKSQKPLECSFCGRSFRHMTAFTVHRRIHTGEKPYSCPTCGKRFSQLSQLSVHSKVHREPHAVCCPCCSETFKNKDELVLHFHIHMKDTESFKQDSNNQQDGTSLPSPVAPSHNKPFRCTVCFKEFLNRATFKMHRRTHGEKPHTCSVCGKKFCKSSSLNTHERTHWPVKPYSCSVCCKSFLKLQELRCHSQMHSGATPFSCARCEKAFSSFESLRSHQVAEVCSEKQDASPGNQSDIDGFLVSHSVQGQIVTPMYFKCMICKQLHRHWCQYILHLQTHTHGKSYTCETCRQQYDKTTEMRSHCIVCCRNSGEERACRSALTDIWKEPEENKVLEPHLDDQSEPPDEDQTGQMSLPQVETGVKEVTDTQAPSPSCSSLSDITAPPSLSSTADRMSRQPSGFCLRSLIRRHCDRYSCGRCGKSFSRWNKLWLHQRFHRQSGRSFSCSRCDLEFRFLGSYIDHQREHAAQTPHACSLCPDAFASEENLNTHISEFHKQHDFIKCSTCGKNFSTLTNLKKHKLLHKRASSHFCLPCNVSFSSNSALKTHLETHTTRLNVPQPAGLVEPLLFPYHCRKCTAKFSSTDLLQAHQVCHYTAGEKTESPPESVASCIPRRTPEDTRAVPESSQLKRRLPVSNKKHLFRYPHPDRLYVVPVVSSEPPVVISDAEEEQQENQVQSPSVTTSASNTVSHFPQPGASFTSSHASISNLPQSMDEHETGSSKNQHQDHSDKSSILPESHQDQDACSGANDISGSDSDSSESLFSNEKELVDDVHSCAICMYTFTDISELHEHYMDHARGV